MFYVLKKCVLFPTLCTGVLISSILPYSSRLVYDFGNGNAYTLINLGFFKAHGQYTTFQKLVLPQILQSTS